MAKKEPTIKKIGRYEVIRKIATGGMAELFLARFVGPGGFEKRCALKRILPQFAADETFTRMFLNEARVTAMFDHPNLVQIFELGQDEQGQFYIAMELVNGLNLRQLNTMCVEKGTLIPPELAAYMMTQALDGLEYAHNFRDPQGQPLNLVHRDISPQNILVSYEGAVKLVDFGIVKGASISGETQAGMLKGKVAYMSPEQASGEMIDRRSDLFSLGVCFYELVVGERPFLGNNEIMTLKSILEEAPPPLTDFLPDCPFGIERAIYQSLEKYPDARYESARAFQMDLQNVLRECPTPLGRHVVAEFIQSLTESETDSSFDATKLKIPRYGAGLAPSAPPTGERSDSAGPPGTPYVPTTTRPRPSGSSQPGVRIPHRRPGIPDMPHTPTPTADHSQVSTMSGITADAGFDRRFSPGIVLAFLLSAIIGAFAVWWATHDDAITIESADQVVVAKLPPPVEEKPVEEKPVVEKKPVEEKKPAVVEKKPAAEEKRSARRRRPRRRAVPTGRVSVESVPRGLNVRLGRRRLGTTPFHGKLPLGSHTLTLSSKRLGIRRSVRVDVTEDGVAKGNVVFTRGSVRVLSRPWALVYVDGVEKGRTPIQIPLYEGEHTLRLVSEDSGEQIRKIVVKPGEEQLLTVKF